MKGLPRDTVAVRYHGAARGGCQSHKPLNHPHFGAASSTAAATAANASAAFTCISARMMRSMVNTLHCLGSLLLHHRLGR